MLHVTVIFLPVKVLWGIMAIKYQILDGQMVRFAQLDFNFYNSLADCDYIFFLTSFVHHVV